MITVYEWADELKSGKWVPSFGAMKSSTVINGRCPFGVLAELIGASFTEEDVYLSLVPVGSTSSETGFKFVTQVLPWFAGFPEHRLAEMCDEMFYVLSGDAERLVDGQVPDYGTIPLVLRSMHDSWTLRGFWPDPWQVLQTRVETSL